LPSPRSACEEHDALLAISPSEQPFLDGVFTRDEGGNVQFHGAPAPDTTELHRIAQRVQARAVAWLRRHGRTDDRPLEEQSNELPETSAIDACAAIAM
jgi:hypothetical protein